MRGGFLFDALVLNIKYFNSWLPILDDFRIACHEYSKKRELTAFVQEHLL